MKNNFKRFEIIFELERTQFNWKSEWWIAAKEILG